MEMNEAEYRELIREYKLTGVEEYLLSNTRPVITLETKVPEDYTQTGNSRVAGDPDLPAGFTWPLTAAGVPMTFIAQLNMQEISRHDTQQLLPAAGMLYFFMGDDEPANNIAHKIFYIADNTGLQRTAAPGETILEEDGPFVGYQLMAGASLTPPNFAYADYNRFSEEELNSLIKLTAELNPGLGQLWGYANGQHGDDELEAAMYLVAKQSYDYSAAKARKKLLDHFNGDEQKVTDALKDILMLLQLNTDYDIGFSWWDAGCIHFFIQKDDLLNKRFDNTYLSLYSS